MSSRIAQNVLTRMNNNVVGVNKSGTNVSVTSPAVSSGFPDLQLTNTNIINPVIGINETPLLEIEGRDQTGAPLSHRDQALVIGRGGSRLVINHFSPIGVRKDSKNRNVDIRQTEHRLGRNQYVRLYQNFIWVDASTGAGEWVNSSGANIKNGTIYPMSSVSSFSLEGF